MPRLCLYASIGRSSDYSTLGLDLGFNPDGGQSSRSVSHFKVPPLAVGVTDFDGYPRSNMVKQGKFRRYSAHACRALAVAILLFAWIRSAAGFTDDEMREIYRNLDPENHGQVTNIQFQINKMNAFYFRHRPTARWEMKPLSFEETGLSRAFFDKVDKDHDGHIDSIEIIDAIRFEDIDIKRRGYFDFSDLVVYLNKIGR